MRKLINAILLAYVFSILILLGVCILMALASAISLI